MTTVKLALLANSFDNTPYEVDFEIVKRVNDSVSNITGILLGVMAGFIIVGLFVITVIDLCYIMIPPLQEVARGKNWDGASSSGSKFRIISRDAYSAVNDSYTGDANTLSLYLKRRISTYLKSAIMLYIIIAGSDVIVSIVTNLMGGFLRAIL